MDLSENSRSGASTPTPMEMRQSSARRSTSRSGGGKEEEEQPNQPEVKSKKVLRRRGSGKKSSKRRLKKSASSKSVDDQIRLHQRRINQARAKQTGSISKAARFRHRNSSPVLTSALRTNGKQRKSRSSRNVRIGSLPIHSKRKKRSTATKNSMLLSPDALMELASVSVHNTPRGDVKLSIDDSEASALGAGPLSSSDGGGGGSATANRSRRDSMSSGDDPLGKRSSSNGPETNNSTSAKAIKAKRSSSSGSTGKGGRRQRKRRQGSGRLKPRRRSSGSVNGVKAAAGGAARKRVGRSPQRRIGKRKGVRPQSAPQIPTHKSPTLSPSGLSLLESTNTNSSTVAATTAVLPPQHTNGTHVAGFTTTNHTSPISSSGRTPTSASSNGTPPPPPPTTTTTTTTTTTATATAASAAGTRAPKAVKFPGKKLQRMSQLLLEALSSVNPSHGAEVDVSASQTAAHMEVLLSHLAKAAGSAPARRHSELSASRPGALLSLLTGNTKHAVRSKRSPPARRGTVASPGRKANGTGHPRAVPVKVVARSSTFTKSKRGSLRHGRTKRSSISRSRGTADESVNLLVNTCLNASHLAADLHHLPGLLAAFYKLQDTRRGAVQLRQARWHESATPEQAGLFHAVTAGRAEVVEDMLRSFRPLNVDTLFWDGETALVRATRLGHAGVVQSLLSARANTEMTNTFGLTPLFLASLHGHSGLVKSLLAAKANTQAMNIDGAGPVHAACQNGDVPTIELLLKASAHVNAKTFAGWMPLHYASCFGNVDAVRYLLQKHHASVLEDKMGQTPLNVAQSDFIEELFGLRQRAARRAKCALLVETEVQQRAPDPNHEPSSRVMHSQTMPRRDIQSISPEVRELALMVAGHPTSPLSDSGSDSKQLASPASSQGGGGGSSGLFEYADGDASDREKKKKKKKKKKSRSLFGSFSLKRKKNHRSKSLDRTVALHVSVFGNSLLCTDPSPAEHNYVTSSLTVVPRQCIQFLRANGLRKEGIFRISPTKSEIENLKAWFEQGEALRPTHTAFSVHAVASVMSYYLRSLPEPVIGRKAMQKVTKEVLRIPTPTASVKRSMTTGPSLQRKRSRTLMSTKDLASAEQRPQEERVAAFGRMLDSMSPLQRGVLRDVVLFLHDVTTYAHENKMTAANLAVLVTPNIVHPDHTPPTQGGKQGPNLAAQALLFLSDFRHSIIVMEFLIRDAVLVFREQLPASASQ